MAKGRRFDAAAFDAAAFDALAFGRDGFCQVDQLLTLDECAQLGAQLERAEPRAGERHLLDHPALAAVLANPALTSLIRHALGAHVFASEHAQPYAFAYKATLFDKHTNANWLVAWHQDVSIPVAARVDQAGWRGWSVKDGVDYVQPPTPVLASLVALRLHLDDCGRDNGPLRVLAASHTCGRVAQDDIAALAQSHHEHIVTGAAGSALLMRPLLVHASSKMLATKRRRVLHLEFAADELPDGLQWHRQVCLGVDTKNPPSV